MGMGMGMGRERKTNLEILRSSDAPLLDVPLQSTDRVLGAPHLLDLVTGTVGSSGVGHSVCHNFQVLSKQTDSERTKQVSWSVHEDGKTWKMETYE